MSSLFYGIDDQKTTASTIQPSEWNYVADVLSTQLTGALLSLGIGIVPLPDDTSLEVTAGAALSVNVAAGATILQRSDGMPCFVYSGNSVPVSGLTDNTDQNYVFAVYIPINTINGPSETTRRMSLQVLNTDILSGGIPLAQVTCAGGAVTNVADLRVLIDTASLSAALTTIETEIAALQGMVGLPYDPTALGTIKDRLAALDGQTAPPVTPPPGTLPTPVTIAPLQSDFNSLVVMKMSVEQALFDPISAKGSLVAMDLYGITGNGELLPDGTTQDNIAAGGNSVGDPISHSMS